LIFLTIFLISGAVFFTENSTITSSFGYAIATLCFFCVYPLLRMLYCCSRSAPFVCMRLCCREAITRDYRWLRTTMSNKLYRLMTTFTIRDRSFHIFYNYTTHYLLNFEKYTGCSLKIVLYFNNFSAFVR